MRRVGKDALRGRSDRMRVCFFFQAEDGIRDYKVTGVQTCALPISRDLGIGAPMMGVVFSAFSWTYALMQIPGGIFLDRFGTRLTYMLSVCSWSFFKIGRASCRERV